jgi:hypothetical protein
MVRQRQGRVTGTTATRRRLLSTGTGVAAGLAGCTDSEDATATSDPATDTQVTQTAGPDVESVHVARDGAHLEELVANLSMRESIWLQPNTTYTIRDTLSVPKDAAWWSIVGMAHGSRQSTMIEPAGDFTAIEVLGNPRGEGDGWLGQWGISNVFVKASNLTENTDAWVIGNARMFTLDRCGVAYGSVRDGFYFGDPDRPDAREEGRRPKDQYAAAQLHNLFVGSAAKRYDVFLGATSTVRAEHFDLYGNGESAIRMEDAIEVFVRGANLGDQDVQFDVRAPGRTCRNIVFDGVHVEATPEGEHLHVGAGSEFQISNVTVRNMTFESSPGAYVEGPTESVQFYDCNWQQPRFEGGPAIRVPEDTDVGHVYVSPSQTVVDDTFDVDAPDGVVRFGATTDEAPFLE